MINLIIVSGVSGSGKSTAINALEDLGYFCVDNLPPTLIPTFIELCANSAESISKVALVMDIREGVFLERAPDVIEELKKKNGYGVELLFLESSNEAVVRRYKETRRKHPLSADGNILEGIIKEREMLSPIKSLANHVINTSSFNVHQLREIVQDTFGKTARRRMSINFLSFGYKYGFPYDADLVFDVRFLPSPHFVEGLKDLTGADKRIQNFIFKDESGREFIQKLVDLLKFLFPRYEKEGKTSLTVAIGCTGGKHRSVVITNKVAEKFKRLSPNVWHRDILKS
ncbi:MAG TPA: RNase adapter RapZ [Thermodesulfobacteriota bacterium]|nr:RNase adapter RapZ [Thermodesulfobacteriota bacterium]